MSFEVPVKTQMELSEGLVIWIWNSQYRKHLGGQGVVGDGSC